MPPTHSSVRVPRCYYKWCYACLPAQRHRSDLHSREPAAAAQPVSSLAAACACMRWRVPAAAGTAYKRGPVGFALTGVHKQARVCVQETASHPSLGTGTPKSPMQAPHWPQPHFNPRKHHAQSRTHARTHARACTRTHSHTRTLTYTYTHARAHAHAHIHTNTHPHTFSNNP
jgi:hypothetical protein